MELNELTDLLKSLLQVTVILQPSELMTYDEACKLLSVSRDYLKRHTEIPRYQPSHNLVYFRRSDLESFVFTQRMISKDDFLQKMEDLVINRQLPTDGVDPDAVGEAIDAAKLGDGAEACGEPYLNK